jgi:1-acyl-sn-glycerol-3-phosphate acyltransferase
MTTFGRICFWITRGAVVGVFRLYWRVRIVGGDHVPAAGAFIVAPVHRSNVDFIAAAMVTTRRVRFLVKHTVWKVAPLGWAVGAMGAIPVERGTADRAALRTVEAALRAGEPVVIFPEGTRQSGATVRDLFDGVAYVSQKTGAPIVPVGIAGTAEAMPAGSRWIRPARVTVVIGEPVAPAPSEGRVSRRQVREQTEALAVAVQDAFDAARRL